MVRKLTWLVAAGVSHHSLPRTYKSSSFSPLRHGRKRLRRSTSVTDLTQGGGGVLLQQPGGVNPNVQKPRATLLSQKSLQFDDPIASNHQIERIIFKIQQDNKILAELDKNAGESLTRTYIFFFFFFVFLFSLLSLLPSSFFCLSSLSLSLSLLSYHVI